MFPELLLFLIGWAWSVVILQRRHINSRGVILWGCDRHSDIMTIVVPTTGELKIRSNVRAIRGSRAAAWRFISSL
jgi:hypothetical protein